MGKSKKLSASEIDGVNYHRARWWQIALGQTNGLISSAFGVMIGVISYLANSGYGVVVSVVGIILTVSRVFDGLIDPVIALIIDKMDTRFGKIRIMMTIGFLIRTFAVFMLFVWGSGKFGIVFFIVMYLVYILGNSIGDIAANMYKILFIFISLVRPYGRQSIIPVSQYLPLQPSPVAVGYPPGDDGYLPGYRHPAHG